MGAIRQAVKDVDPSTEVGKVQKELVENLAKLAESKAELFEMEVSNALRTAGSPENQTIPVEAVIDSVTQTHAYASSQTSQQITTTVKEALKNFVTGGKEEIVAGVADLIGGALTAFLGEAEASEKRLKRYYILTEGLSIVRVDLRAWSLTVTAQGIQKSIQKVSAFVAVKSAVDLAKIRFNTFLNLYQEQLRKMKGFSEDDIQAELEEAEKIYNRFRGTGSGLRAPQAAPVLTLKARPATAM